MRRFAAALLLACACAGAAGAAPAHLYEVVLNGHDSGKTLVFDGAGAALATQWSKLGLTATDGESAGRLGITAKVDTATQTVMLTVPACLLPKQAVQGSARGGYTLSPKASGVVLDYDFAGSWSPSAGAAASLGLDARVPTRWGVFEQQGYLDFGGPRPGYQRTATRWMYDDPSHLLSWQAGDVLPTNPIGASVFGFSVSKTYALAPGLRTWPAPTIDGIAVDPGTLEILAGQAMVEDKTVHAGPITITPATALAGATHLSAVVDDGYGRLTPVGSLDWYGAPNLLRPGYSTWDFSLGTPRQLDGSYQGWLASGDFRRGINDWLTGMGSFAVGSGGWSGSASAQASSMVGEWNASIGASSGGGHEYLLGWTYQRGEFSAHAEHDWRHDFWSPGATLLQAQTATSDSAGASWSRGPWRFDVSATRLESPAFSSRYGTITARWRHGPVSLDFGGYAGNHDRGLFADLSVSLGHVSAASGFQGSTAYIDAGYSNADFSGVASVNHTSAGNMEQVRGNVRTTLGMGNFGVQVLPHDQIVTGEWQGSLVLSPRPQFSRPLSGEAMVKVVVPGIAGVPVYAAGTYVGKTDSSGVLVFGPAEALASTPVHLDLSHVPMDVEVEQADQRAVPSRDGIALLVFPVHRILARMWRLEINSKPVPVTAKADGAVIGPGGEFLVATPRPGQVFNVAWQGGLCTATLPAKMPAYDDIEVLQCR